MGLSALSFPAVAIRAAKSSRAHTAADEARQFESDVINLAQRLGIGAVRATIIVGRDGLSLGLGHISGLTWRIACSLQASLSSSARQAEGLAIQRLTSDSRRPTDASAKYPP